MKNASLIVLKALLEGQEIEMSITDEQSEIFMLYDGKFGIRREQTLIKDGKEVDRQDVFLLIDVPLDDFIKMCHKLDESTLSTIVARMALSGWQKRTCKSR
jgi:hypothetical protein